MTQDLVEKMRKAFEHENRIRNKVVKAVSDVTGISEKYLVQESPAEIRGRMREWVKDLKRKVRASVPDLEDRVEELEGLLEEKDAELQAWSTRSNQIRGSVERLCADVESHVRKIRLFTGLGGTEGDEEKL